MEKVRLGIIGTGGLAQNQHIPNICMQARNAELHVLCDLRPDVLEKLGKYYGVGRLETDYQKVLADQDVEGVVIVTKEDSHVPLTLAALEAGKHVYVEKPLADNAAACDKVVALQKKTGKRVFVGMNRRLAPAYVYAKELLWKNGGPKNMFYRIADGYSLGWGQNHKGGQRVVHEICHIFDILRFFAESEVRSVYALEARPDDEQFMLRFESGAVATILGSGYVGLDMPKERFEAIAAKGAVTVEDFSEVRRYSFDDGKPVETFAGHWHPMRDRLHAPLLKELGAAALHAIRKTNWDAVRRYDELNAKGETGTEEFERLEEVVKNHLPMGNYFMDKGWLGTIEHFAACVRDADLEQLAAGAFDGLQAARITEAAIKSRGTGEVVHLGRELSK